MKVNMKQRVVALSAFFTAAATTFACINVPRSQKPSQKPSETPAEPLTAEIAAELCGSLPAAAGVRCEVSTTQQAEVFKVCYTMPDETGGCETRSYHPKIKQGL